MEVFWILLTVTNESGILEYHVVPQSGPKHNTNMCWCDPIYNIAENKYMHNLPPEKEKVLH